MGIYDFFSLTFLSTNQNISISLQLANRSLWFRPIVYFLAPLSKSLSPLYYLQYNHLLQYSDYECQPLDLLIWIYSCVLGIIIYSTNTTARFVPACVSVLHYSYQMQYVEPLRTVHTVLNCSLAPLSYHHHLVHHIL
jgi:hypothetical protein